MVLPCYTPILMILIPIFGTSKYLQISSVMIKQNSHILICDKKYQKTSEFAQLYYHKHYPSKASGSWNPLLQRRKHRRNIPRIDHRATTPGPPRSEPCHPQPGRCSKGQPQGLQGLRGRCRPSRTCLPGATNNWAFSGMVLIQLGPKNWGICDRRID